MPTLHIMHGFIAAGKTTYSQKLADSLRCVRLSSDEWMVALYGTNPPEEVFRTAVARVHALVEDMAEKILHTGQDVIIDTGAWRRIDRARLIEIAKRQGADYKLYWVHCDESVARARLQARSAAMPAGQLFIDLNAYDRLRKQFEPLDTAAEPHTLIDNTELMARV